jgi:outer membrane biogenesis lipoprotein LolB
MRCVAMVLGVLLLTGCATTLRVEQSPPFVLSLAQIKAAENFSVNGRFSAKRGDQQGSGQFRYSQRGATRTLDIFTPTSTQLARIEATATSARASLNDGTTRDAATLSELLRQFIDIPIGDAEFSSWLQALPRNTNVSASLASDGKIESFRESGWTIVVNGRFDGDAGFVRRMRWSFDAGDAAQAAEVRWVFDEFSTQ